MQDRWDCEKGEYAGPRMSRTAALGWIAELDDLLGVPTVCNRHHHSGTVRRIAFSLATKNRFNVWRQRGGARAGAQIKASHYIVRTELR